MDQCDDAPWLVTDGDERRGDNDPDRQPELIEKLAGFHGDAERPFRLATHDVHVRGGGAYVLCGYVPALQRVDDPAVGPEESLRLVLPRIADDHSLARI